MCLIEVEDHFVRSFAILTHMNMHDQNIHMIVSDMSGLKKYIKEKGVIQTQRFNCITKKMLQFSSRTFGYYPHFLSAIFGAYSLSLFGFSVIYFLSRIVGYKLGFVRGPTYHKYCPRRRGSGKSYIRSIRYKNDRHRKKRRIKKKRVTRSPFVKLFSSALTTVLNVDKRVRTRDLLPYDTDSTTMVRDNSANVHICNKRNMFVWEIRKCTNQGVATIVVKGHQPSGIGTVCWMWRDDSGKSHDYLVKDVLFSPHSPINILSVTCFAQQLNDLTGTGIDTK